MNPTTLKRLAWARSQRFVKNSVYLYELKSEHIVSRYFALLGKNMTTEDIDYLLDKSEYITYSASNDFAIQNKVGYFLKTLDNLANKFSIDPDKLKEKLRQGSIDWNKARIEVLKYLKS